MDIPIYSILVHHRYRPRTYQTDLGKFLFYFYYYRNRNNQTEM